MDREYLDQNLIDLGTVSVETKGVVPGNIPDGLLDDRAPPMILGDD